MTHSMTNLEEAAASCMKCGFCKAACPLFLGEETTSPRAKVRLARAVAQGEIELTRAFKRQMDRCLNCRSCAAECPSGVEPNRIVLACRNAMFRQGSVPLLRQMIFRSCLKRPWLMALGARIIGHWAWMDLPTNPLRCLLPLIGMRVDKDLPPLGRGSLFTRLPEVLEPFGEHKTTVVYFPGCSVNLVYPEIGLATVSVLRKLGAKVLRPLGLVCCSTPVFNAGDIDCARDLARRNIDLLAPIDADFIVTSCGSCGLTLKHEWTEVLGLADAAAIGSKVLDIAEFTARFAQDGALRPLDEPDIVTYHDSCHLRRGMAVHKEPRQLLSAALGSRFVEMEQPDRCCGGGGTFSLYQPELSQIVAETKMERLRESGAGTVATGCPACVMQLRDSIVHRRMPHRAAHTVEFIDRALRTSE